MRQGSLLLKALQLLEHAHFAELYSLFASMQCQTVNLRFNFRKVKPLCTDIDNDSKSPHA